MADADLFFGREHDLRACLTRLRDVGTVSVVGPSGCGKSSLVRAGVAATLGREGAQVRVVTPGARPLDMLEGAPRLRPGTVLVVDQCEEAFAQLSGQDQQVAFLDGLLQHAARGPLVLSLRADRVGALSVHPEFARLAESGLYLLGGMDRDGLRSAIEDPARQAGLVLEPGLVDLVARDLEGQPGALPMMSHALRACWARREGRTLTVGGYNATGGIREAVARSAEEVYEQVGPAERLLMRDLMLRLVMPGPEGEPVRSQVPRRLVVADAEHDRVIELLVKARLVTSGGDSIELAHEALARAWPRLRNWLDDDMEGHRILRHLAEAADAWLALGKPESELYRGVRLAAAREWRARSGPDLTATEREFLDASDDLETREHLGAEAKVRRERKVNRRLRALLLGVLVLLLVASLAGWGAVRQARRADVATRESDSRLAGARGLLADQPDLAVLLALAGVRIDDSPETRANLLATVTRAPQLIGAASGKGGAFGGLETSPDGSTMAVYDDRNEVWLYDTRTRQVRARYDADGGKPQIAFWPVMAALDFSPDGRRLAVGKFNLDPDSVVLLDARTMEPLPDQVGGLPSRPSLVNDVRFSADGTRLAAAFIEHNRGSDAWVASTVLVWDTADLAHPVNRIRLESPGLVNLSFGTDRERLWVYREGPSAPHLATYRLRTGDRETVRPVPTPMRAWTPFQVREDGRQLAFLDGRVVVLMDTGTGRVRRLVGHEGTIDNLAYSADGRFLASGAEDRTALVWDTRTGTLLERFRTESTETYGIRFSPDGRTLYTAGTDRQLQVWDVAGGQRFIRRLRVLRDVDLGEGWVLPAPAGDRVAYAWNGEARRSYLRIVQVAHGRASRLIDTGHGEYGAWDWSPDGRRFATTGGDGVVRVWDRTGRLVHHRAVVSAHISGLQYSDDGRTIVVSERAGKIRWLDAESLAQVGRPLDVGGSVLVLSVAGRDGSKALAVRYAPQPPQPNETYAPAERWALADSATGVVRRGATGVANVSAAGISPDGGRVAFGDTDGRVVLRDAATGDRVRAPQSGHDATVVSLTYGPSSRYVVTGAADGSVSLWNGRDGELLGSVTPSHDAPVSVQVLPDEKTVLIADQQGRFYEWDIRPSHLVDFGCRFAGRDLTAGEWRSVFGERAQVRICPA